MPRKVFISFYGGDEKEVGTFVTWAHRNGALIPKILHDAYSGAWVDSTNTDYVMQRVRDEFIGDSTVTMLLLGRCTHSRRYVDWEIKATLQQGESYLPNGLLAVNLPSIGNAGVHLPPRFLDNYKAPPNTGYARYYAAPSTASELTAWIEDAFSARTTRAKLITNSRDMMRNNAKCQHCGVVHPAS